MKQNITLSLDVELLRAAKQLAAKSRLSLSRLLAEDLAARVGDESEYKIAMQQAFALLDKKLPLGGKGGANRGDLHERAGLR